MERKRERILEPRARHRPVSHTPGVEHRDASQPSHVVQKRTHEPTVVLTLAQRLRRVMAENARLCEQNERYRERLTQWQYNAYKRGLKPHHLEEPLPEVDRQRSV